MNDRNNAKPSITYGGACFLGSVFYYFILRPLYSAINELRTTIRELREDIKHNEERRHAMEIKLAEVDQSTRSAHHRLDTLEKGR